MDVIKTVALDMITFSLASSEKKWAIYKESLVALRPRSLANHRRAKRLARDYIDS